MEVTTDIDLFVIAQSEYGLQAERDVFNRTLGVSAYFKDQMEGILVQGLDSEFQRNLVRHWFPLFGQGVKDHWLSQQIKLAFAIPEADLEAEEETPLFMCQLRFLRALFQIRSIYRECLVVDASDDLFIEQMREYSEFAGAVFEDTETHLRRELMVNWGVEGDLPPLMVFGLGKLGAGELNLSSDVDLIFSYDHTIQLKSDKDRGASEFYTALGQRFIKFLGDITPDGFVFRVDMRLRPFGQSGALVWSSRALETYYEKQGRMWERYAWIKTRAFTGGARAQGLIERLRPFVYRRYVDFGVIEALREMKSLIEREVNRKEAAGNIKVGKGGIREVEFIVQVMQLIRGGELVELQEPSLMKALAAIRDLEVLPGVVIQELTVDYIFLRKIEHFLQAFYDRQTQTLPTTDVDWQRLALAMKIDDIDTLTTKIITVRNRVHQHFQDTIRPPKTEQALPEGTAYWESIWPHNIDQIKDEPVKSLLREFRQNRCLEKASEIALHRLDVLMPTLLAVLQCVAEQESIAKESTMSHQLRVSLPDLDLHWAGVDETLRRVLLILESILRRSAYLSLLSENPQALYRVVKLCSISELMPKKLARFPSLLDEFIDETPVYKALSREELMDELRQQLVRIPEDDFEQQMARLRAFKQRHTLRAAAADIAGHLPLMNVSDYLTWLAEALLQAALDIAWHKLVLKYGEPELYSWSRTGFVVVGYGKLGGLELSYTSDLDIVFLYDVPFDGETQGPKVIENSVFYMQLVKNLNYILMTDTLDGRLYEIDMRLRPSGSAGLLVSTFEGFQKYQEKDAWVWERQALVRARPVAGDTHLFQRFNAIRSVCLMSELPCEDLREKVLEMRDKMKTHLVSSGNTFDLKHGAGGIVDIEFIAQHLVLHCAEDNPVLTKYSDNIRIFELAVSEGVMNKVDGEALIQAYLLYRSVMHRLSLQSKSNIIDDSLLVDIRNSVVDIFERWFKLK